MRPDEKTPSLCPRPNLWYAVFPWFHSDPQTQEKEGPFRKDQKPEEPDSDLNTTPIMFFHVSNFLLPISGLDLVAEGSGMELFFTAPQVARELKVSDRAIRNLCAAGQIKASR